MPEWPMYLHSAWALTPAAIDIEAYRWRQTCSVTRCNGGGGSSPLSAARAAAAAFALLQARSARSWIGPGLPGLRGAWPKTRPSRRPVRSAWARRYVANDEPIGTLRMPWRLLGAE